ncbi:MAG: aminoglycoside phosphotransferase family protein [Gammaproteobacteria bacterium]|nr:aminoglycoside phosphotransferase family protein [Gammaproteobacteria bacterium]
MSLFKILPRYVPDEEELNLRLSNFKQYLQDKLNSAISCFSRISKGQGINFRIYTTDSMQPKYLLRIIVIKGYPSIEVLKYCYTMLDNIGVSHPNMIDIDDSDKNFPYGYILQDWIEGEDAADKFDIEENVSEWVVDFAQILREIHKMEAPYFGDLLGNYKYQTIVEFYDDLFNVIPQTFGDILSGDSPVIAIEDAGIVPVHYFAMLKEQIHALVSSISYKAKPVLVYGDMLPMNLIYTPQGERRLIDFDEVRFSWSIYELARCLFYVPCPNVYDEYRREYSEDAINEIDYRKGIVLEHVRQLLRQIYSLGFLDKNKIRLQATVKDYMVQIEQLLKF